MIKPKSYKIDSLRKRYRNRREWLLIAVDSVDPETNTPLTGRLLGHSQRRDDLVKKYMDYKGRGLAFLDFSAEPPKNVAYIF